MSNKEVKGAAYWDDRFQAPAYAYGEAPNDFLRWAAPQVKPGKALSLCEGEGRNAVFLAKLGFEVTAVDFSSVGLNKAKALADAVLLGHVKGPGGATAAIDMPKALELIGLFVKGLIQGRMSAGIPPPLKASTIARKGSSKPLINTGQLRASIDYEVREVK